MKTIGPAPRRLFLALAALLGLIVVVMSAWNQIKGHGYQLWPPSANALPALRSASRIAWMSWLGFLALSWLPWEIARRRSRPQRSLSILWAALPVLCVWAWWGYRFNRYAAAPQWKHAVERWGMTIPEALVHAPTLVRNASATVLAIVAAYILYRLLRRLMPSSSHDLRSHPAAWIAGLSVPVLLLVGMSSPATLFRPSPSTPDIVLISLDAVRADHLGCYGHPGGLTPELDAFAAEAQRFDRAYSQEPWTLTSHMSMLTGLYPDVHGLDFGRSLPPQLWTLAERLRDAGYRTAASVYDCFLLSPRFGYAAGFDRYEESGTPAQRRCEDAAEWLLEDDRPSFLFLHLYDPHSDTGPLPYEAGDEELARFAPGARKSFAGWASRDGASESLRSVNEGVLELSDSMRYQLRQLYAAGIHETDRAVGEFLRRIREAGRLEDALIIITSDHGEALGEQSHFMHERLMEATLRVPLLVHWPGGDFAGESNGELVELVDVAPTVLELAQLPPESVSQGRSLSALEADPRAFAFHRSGPDYAITTADSWRMLYRLDGGIEPLALRPVDGSGGDGEDVLSTDFHRIEPWLDGLVRLHDANASLAARFHGGQVSMSSADEELLRSLGYID